VHKPIVLSAIFVPGSICHHWQSLHKPQSDEAMTDSFRVCNALKTYERKGQSASWRERFLPAKYPFGVIRNLPLSQSSSKIHTSGGSCQALTVV
jgi:hypothetical protein